jgi:FkbM family methyltransferase
MIAFLKSAMCKRNVYVYRNSLPWGTCLVADIRRLRLREQALTVLDVGANVGGMLSMLRAVAPRATIHAFEPVPSTFGKLQQNAAEFGDVRCHNLAVGSEAGEVTMLVPQLHTMSRICEVGEEGVDGERVEKAERVVLDTWVERAGVDRVDFLKIDTEGFDLDVLAGSAKLLQVRRVTMILVECGFGYSDRHVPLNEYLDYLEPFGFRLLGIYDQSPSPRNMQTKLHLHYGNALFSQADLLERKQ